MLFAAHRDQYDRDPAGQSPQTFFRGRVDAAGPVDRLARQGIRG